MRLLGVPVELLLRSREHLDSLERELRLLDSGGSDEPAVTGLLELLADPDRAWCMPGRADDDQIDGARQRGEDTVDLVVQVAPAMVGACRDADELLDEADRCCQRGQLLNPGTSAECVALRRWYLGQLLRQMEGAPPSPWSSSR